MFCLRSQVAAQEKRNTELAVSNMSFRKKNVELGEEKKDLSVKVVELKSRNEELDDNHNKLIEENAKLVG